MRDHSLHTPQKTNRSAKSISDKKNQKSVKKNLNPSLSAVSEDAPVFESPENLNLNNFASISEISGHNLSGELYEDMTALSSVGASPGSEDADSYVLTPVSSTITFDDHERSVASTNQCIEKSENMNLICFEAELVVKYLREAQLQLFNARTMDLQSKMLLDALINVIIKEFYDMPHKEEGYNEVIPRKAYLAFISILLSILAATVVIICFSGSTPTFNGPRPT